MQLEDLSGLMTLRRFVEVAHHIPGRIRLRFTNRLISGLSKNKLSALEEICHPEGYLRSYSLNTATGSLVLEYSAAHISPATLNQLLAMTTLSLIRLLNRFTPLFHIQKANKGSHYE